MSKRKKLIRFQELRDLPHVISASDERKGQWANAVFHNTHPIILELGCGTGAYTLALAQLYPEKNFIGIDIKGERLWRGAKTALETSLANVAFLQGNIQHIVEYFGPGEVSEIWITFPDPFPRTKQAKRRLTAPSFLEQYEKIVVPGGRLHLKTDVPALIAYTMGTVGVAGGTIEVSVPNVYAPTVSDPLLSIQTTFEKKHLAKGKTIGYLRARLN